MHDHGGNRSCIPDAPEGDMHDHGQSLAITGLSGKTDEDDARDTHDRLPRGSCKTPTFVGAPEAAKLLERDPSTVTRQCDSGTFTGATKTLVNGIKVWQIPISSLPLAAQRKLKAELDAARAARLAAVGIVIPPPESRHLQPAEYTVVWEAYERSGATHKRHAERAFKVMVAFNDLVDSGRSMGEAEKAVASSFGVSRATLYRYRDAIKGHPRMHWLPFLSPRYKGGRPCAPFTKEAYAYILGKYLNTSETKLTVVLEAARALAPSMGWEIPSYDAVRDRLRQEPKWLDTVGRKGPKALERSYPAIERDYSNLRLHEYWESDGRRADVLCIWPDGTLARPFIIIFREVRSRLVLGVKGYLNPSAAGVLAVFGQAMERTGVAPDYVKIDNGREYAAKSVTGGQDNRYRFKIVPGEQPGIMTRVGTKADWSPPGRGQDKTLESGWNFVADRCDKAPEFEGAYCGRNTVAKPEGFDRSKAIPIAVYAEKLAAVLEYFNNQHRHTGSGMNGRTPMEVYQELSAQTVRPAVDPAHVRLCKMGVAYIKPSATDSTYSLTIPGYGVCRYWSEKIAGLTRECLSRKHTVYYDLEAPEKPVSIYDGHNWLGDAASLDTVPFNDEGGERAGAHVRAKNAAMKPQKAALKAIKNGAQSDLPALPGVTQLTELPPMPAVTIEGRRTLPAENKTAPLQTPGMEKEEERLAELARRRKEQIRITDPRRYSILYGD
ncbi:MAG: hypothetical protein HWD57_21275 [Candidatus Accumulibacter cognatus]|nr:MAG: hypothetical protein HWD57_21275 [Candidatus Accumulibacter cognatus]